MAKKVISMKQLSLFPEQVPEELVGPEPTIPSMTDEELKQFVLDYVGGRIFAAQDIPGDNIADMIGSVFMVVALGGLGEINPHEIGTIYEYRHLSANMSVNGCPIFFSCKIMNKEDWDRAAKAIARELERQKSIEI